MNILNTSKYIKFCTLEGVFYLCFDKRIVLFFLVLLLDSSAWYREKQNKLSPPKVGVKTKTMSDAGINILNLYY